MPISRRDDAIAGEKLRTKSLSEDYGRLANVAIEQVCSDSAVRPRDKLNRSVVREYFALMQADENFFPPLHVVAADSEFLLIDGYHRLEAAKLAKLKTVRCSVHAGDRRHAILLSSSANVRNGLGRTIADKRRAVTKLLSDPEWFQWSDHEIARYCSVSQPFVSGLRSEMRFLTDNVIGETAANGERRFITKHGSPAVMHLPARQRSSAVASEPVQPLTKSGGGAVDEAGLIPVEDVQGARARFIEAVVTCEQVIRATDVTSIRAGPAADDALYHQLTTLARLLTSAADVLVRRG